MLKCSLQINLAPNDYLHAQYIVPHQIKTFINQVDEIVLILDTHRSKGRFGNNWDENLVNIKNLITAQCAIDKKIRTVDVEYSAGTMKKIAELFFGSAFIPKKDFRGGPFYAYFFGVYNCRSNYVLHMDSDMFLGGGSQTWIQEAIDLLSSNDDIFTCSPLPGPPHPDHILINQPTGIKLNANYEFKFDGMSTRIFMLDKHSFDKRKLILSPPSVKNRIKALIRQNLPYDLPEHIISKYMRSNNLSRIDFLGTGKGMWSLHPPFRSKSFYDSVPQIINKVNNGDLDAAQNGNYDIVDEVCDWTEAREKLKNNR
jgi:hypothetical protein